LTCRTIFVRAARSPSSAATKWSRRSINLSKNSYRAANPSWPVHCVQNTSGAEFYKDLVEDPRIRVVSKGLGDEDQYSAFDGTKLAEELHRLGIKEVWVGGLATDYCVKNTVLDALREGFKVKALTEAMRAVNIQPGDDVRAIEEMQSAGAEII
jgi:nicotinamidase/pyrazinamidase